MREGDCVCELSEFVNVCVYDGVERCVRTGTHTHTHTHTHTFSLSLTDTLSQNEVLVSTPKRNYTSSDYVQLLEDLGLQDKVPALKRSIADPDLLDFRHPGVNTFVTYGFNVPTPGEGRGESVFGCASVREAKGSTQTNTLTHTHTLSLSLSTSLSLDLSLSLSTSLDLSLPLSRPLSPSLPLCLCQASLNFPKTSRKMHRSCRSFHRL